jgi:hypothetical protein
VRNLLYDIRICKKAIIKSQRQIMCGSNIYGSDVIKNSMHICNGSMLQWIGHWIAQGPLNQTSLDSIIGVELHIYHIHDTKLQTVDPAAGPLSRELSLMSTGFDLYLFITR